MSFEHVGLSMGMPVFRFQSQDAPVSPLKRRFAQLRWAVLDMKFLWNQRLLHCYEELDHQKNMHELHHFPKRTQFIRWHRPL
jgi:hypothetical protein